MMEAASRQPVLVTGASGFIGRRLVRRLIDLRYPVFCLVRASSHIDELLSVGAQLIRGEVTDRNNVERALAQSHPGTVFHLAGLVKAHNRNEFKQVNEGGVQTVASACASYVAHPESPPPKTSPPEGGQPSPRNLPVLVVVSSLSAAGPGNADYLRVESDAPTPVSNYGRSKLAGEQAAARFAGAVPISIVRPSIVFGPGDEGVFQIIEPIARWGLHLVPGRNGRFATRCSGSKVSGGKGEEQLFSLIHVDDLVEGLLLVAEKGERMREQESPTSHSLDGQGIYFIAGNEHPTYAQLGQIIANALEQSPPAIIHLPGSFLRVIGIGSDMMARVRSRPAWISSDKITEALAGSWTCSSDKARTHLGWSPAANLVDRLGETVRWYRQAGWL